MLRQSLAARRAGHRGALRAIAAGHRNAVIVGGTQAQVRAAQLHPEAGTFLGDEAEPEIGRNAIEPAPVLPASQPEGGLGINHLPSECEPVRPACKKLADIIRPRRHVRPADFGAAEFRRRHAAANITRQRQIKTAAHRVAVDRCNDRFVHLQCAQIAILARSEAGAFHLAFGEREIFLQVAANAERVCRAGENDGPDIVIFLRFLPRAVERSVKIAADRVLLLGAIETNDRRMRLALFID